MAIEKKPSVNNTFNKKQKFIDAAMARAYIEDCDKRLKRSRIGLIVGVIVPIFDAIIAEVLSKHDKFGESTFMIWILAAVVAYIFGGGLFLAVRMVLKVTVEAYLAGGTILIGLLFAAVAFCFVGAFALFLPVVIIYLLRVELIENKEEAESFLAGNSLDDDYFGPQRICGSCGAVIQTDAPYCTVCGAKQDKYS